MRKSLILLPLATVLLTACLPPKPSDTTSSGTSTGSTTGTSSGPTISPTTGDDPSGAVDFVLSAGTHTAILDFENDPDRYTYPRAEAEHTVAQQGDFGGLSWNIFHSYKGSYEGQYWLMMKNKDGWDATGQAWFGNSVSLGSITSIEVTVRNGASSKLNYDLSVGSSAFSSAQTSGTQFAVGTAGTYSGSGKGFFAVSTKPITGSSYQYNGQIAKIKVVYTIS